MSAARDWLAEFRRSVSAPGPRANSANGADRTFLPERTIPIGTVGIRRMERNEEKVAWDFHDWRVFFDERAAIAEYSGISRAAAEARAYECCIVMWLNRNPAPLSSAEICGECGQPIAGTNALPFLNGPDGHAWIHPNCHAPWMERRRAIAQRRFVELGIPPPNEVNDS